MSGEPKRAARTGVVVVVVLLAFYLLGAGPAYRWGFLGDADARRWTDRVYWPLARAARYQVPGRMLAAYVNLWSPPLPVEWIGGEGLSYRIDP
jgi:hypothetical protein